MRDVSISEFKANCFRLIARVEKSGSHLRVLRRGQPVAEITPIARVRKRRFVLGDISGTAEIVGDIVSPVIAAEDLPSKC